MPSITLLLWFVLMCPLTAHAYVGPGLGIGVVGVIIGVFFSIFLAIIGVFWYPLKRFFKKGTKKQ